MAGSRVHLNFNRTWADVGSIVTAMDKKTHTPIGFVRDAFKNQLADRVHLKPGFKLYKFNNGNSLVPPWAEEGVTIKGARMLSEWWSPFDQYTHEWQCQRGVTVDPGWIARANMAKTLGISVREWGRITSVVKENWNSLEWLLVITLKVNAYAWFGQFASMGRIDPGAATKRKAGESAIGDVTNATHGGIRKFTSAGMAERVGKFGNRGTLAGGGTQFYLPGLRAMHIDDRKVDFIDLRKL